MSGSRRLPSVAEHRFGATAPFTIGIEEEYMLLDPETLDLTARIERILGATADGSFAEQVSAELFESLLEIRTPICATTAEAVERLREVRAHVAAAARDEGLLVASAGTHPFSLFERQRVTGRERYRRLIEELQYAARRELNFGLHVHVAVDGPDKAIAVLRSVLAHVAELVALTANSPFWRGEPTGVMSSRLLVFATMPRTGPPPPFYDYGEFADVVGRLEAAGCIEDYTRIWWDARPHPRLGTIEIRVMDGVTRVDDAAALAAYLQALVKLYSDRYDAGDPLPAPHQALVAENKWQATRYGLDARVIDLVGDAPSIAVQTAIRRTLRQIAPHARELGGERELAGIRRILQEGNGAQRQFRVYRSNHDVVDVTRDLAERTVEGLPVG